MVTEKLSNETKALAIRYGAEHLRREAKCVEDCGECKYHLLHRVRQVKDQIATQAQMWNKHNEDDTETVRMFKDAKASSYEDCIEILNKLIKESEEWICGKTL